MAKAEVCKTSIHRFESDRRLFLVAGVAEFGRRKGLKIPRRLVSVPVRVRPSALKLGLNQNEISASFVFSYFRAYRPNAVIRVGFDHDRVHFFVSQKQEELPNRVTPFFKRLQD